MMNIVMMKTVVYYGGNDDVVSVKLMICLYNSLYCDFLMIPYLMETFGY